MCKKTKSVQKTSDGIRKRASKLLEKDKYKFEIKSLLLSKIAIYISVLTLIFSVFTYYKLKPNKDATAITTTDNATPNATPENKNVFE